MHANYRPDPPHIRIWDGSKAKLKSSEPESPFIRIVFDWDEPRDEEVDQLRRFADQLQRLGRVDRAALLTWRIIEVVAHPGADIAMLRAQLRTALLFYRPQPEPAASPEKFTDLEVVNYLIRTRGGMDPLKADEPHVEGSATGLLDQAWPPPRLTEDTEDPMVVIRPEFIGRHEYTPAPPPAPQRPGVYVRKEDADRLMAKAGELEEALINSARDWDRSWLTRMETVRRLLRFVGHVIDALEEKPKP